MQFLKLYGIYDFTFMMGITKEKNININSKIQWFLTVKRHFLILISFLTMDASFQMKMQAKQLEREAKRMQKESLKEKNKAKAELKKGNRAAANLYAQNSIRYEQQANMLLQQAATANGYSVDLQAGKVNAQMAANMSKATAGLQQATAQVNLQKVSAQRTKMDGLKTRMATANELLTGSSDADGINAGADDLLQALENENFEEATMQISEIPGESFEIPSGQQTVGAAKN